MTLEEMTAIMESLYTHRAPALPARALAAVLDQLIWCLDDNGAALLRVREVWLRSDEREKVEIALSMDETYPFADAAEMDEVLGLITARWPEFSSRCKELSETRNAASARQV